MASSPETNPRGSGSQLPPKVLASLTPTVITSLTAFLRALSPFAQLRVVRLIRVVSCGRGLFTFMAVGVSTARIYHSIF